MDTITDIFKYLESQDKEAMLHFYDRLGFNLTIAIRSIWSNPETSDKEKIEAIKIVNELSYSIFNWMWELKRDVQGFDHLDCFSEIKNRAGQSKNVAGEIEEAIKSSYRHLTKS